MCTLKTLKHLEHVKLSLELRNPFNINRRSQKETVKNSLNATLMCPYHLLLCYYYLLKRCLLPLSARLYFGLFMKMVNSYIFLNVDGIFECLNSYRLHITQIEIIRRSLIFRNKKKTFVFDEEVWYKV